MGKERHDLGGFVVDLLVINFEKERMVLKLPFHKAKQAGLREISSRDDMDNALELLSVKSKPKRAMWGRRAQEYETKINSGSPTCIAEVLRELYCHDNDFDQSYSERQIYQTALERLVRELAIVEDVAETKAVELIEQKLQAA